MKESNYPHSSAQSFSTRCEFAECFIEFVLQVSEVDKSRPVISECPGCLRRQSFKPIEVLRALEKNRHKRSPGSELIETGFCALVEDVRSLHNVGSIFRTSDGAGIGKLYLCGITGMPPRSQITKTSLGAESTVPWEFYPYSVEIISRLKEKGVLIVGLERNLSSNELNATFIQKSIRSPFCLIVGNEVTGISCQGLELCDQVCHLPMRGEKESLNVSVAFGIGSYLLAEVLYGASGSTG